MTKRTKSRSGPKPKPLAQRFWSKVRKGPGCWLFTGAKNNRNYGVICSGGKRGRTLLAHRVGFELVEGRPVAAGMNVLHRCDNPPCVRRSHLFEGTQIDNAMDIIAKGRPIGRPKRVA